MHIVYVDIRRPRTEVEEIHRFMVFSVTHSLELPNNVVLYIHVSFDQVKDGFIVCTAGNVRTTNWTSVGET